MKSSFFCEACGAEVKGSSDRCPSCGRSFMGIRCPRCGKEGNTDDFLKGCPDCGYMTDLSETGKTEGIGHHSRFSGKRSRSYKIWPTSWYWSLSGLLIVVITVILYIWLK